MSDVQRPLVPQQERAPLDDGHHSPQPQPQPQPQLRDGGHQPPQPQDGGHQRTPQRDSGRQQPLELKQDDEGRVDDMPLRYTHDQQERGDNGHKQRTFSRGGEMSSDDQALARSPPVGERQSSASEVEDRASTAVGAVAATAPASTSAAADVAAAASTSTAAAAPPSTSASVAASATASTFAAAAVVVAAPITAAAVTSAASAVAAAAAAAVAAAAPAAVSAVASATTTAIVSAPTPAAVSVAAAAPAVAMMADHGLIRKLRLRLKTDVMLTRLFAPLAILCASRAYDTDWVWYWYWPMVCGYMQLARINQGSTRSTNVEFSRALHGNLIDRTLYDILCILSQIGRFTILSLICYYLLSGIHGATGRLLVLNAWIGINFQVARIALKEFREFRAEDVERHHAHPRGVMRFLYSISAGWIGHLALCLVLIDAYIVGAVSGIYTLSIWIVPLPVMLWSTRIIVQFLRRERHPDWMRIGIAYVSVMTTLLVWLFHHSPKTTFFYEYMPINATVVTSPAWLAGLFMALVDHYIRRHLPELLAPVRFLSNVFELLDSMLRLPFHQIVLTDTQAMCCKRELCAALGGILLRPVLSKFDSRAGLVYDITLVVFWTVWLLPVLRDPSRRSLYGFRADGEAFGEAIGVALVLVAFRAFVHIEDALPMSLKFVACFIFFVVWCTFQHLIVLGVIQRNVLTLTASSANPFGPPGFLRSISAYVLPTLGLYMWSQHVIALTTSYFLMQKIETSQNVYAGGLLSGFIAAGMYWSLGIDPLADVWSMLL